MGFLKYAKALPRLILLLRRWPSEKALTEGQAAVQEATAEQIRAQTRRDDRAADLAVFKESLARLKAELRVERQRVKVLEKQNEDLHAQHRCDLAEIERLKGGGT